MSAASSVARASPEACGPGRRWDEASAQRDTDGGAAALVRPSTKPIQGPNPDLCSEGGKQARVRAAASHHLHHGCCCWQAQLLVQRTVDGGAALPVLQLGQWAAALRLRRRLALQHGAN